MGRRNVTLALDEEILKEARHLAVEEGVSLSALLSRALEEKVLSSANYLRAKERQLRLMAKGLPIRLGESGKPSRDELHARR